MVNLVNSEENKLIKRYVIFQLIIKYQNGGGFKKLYESSNICDYSFIQFKEWEIRDWEAEELKIQNGIEVWRKKCHDTFEETLQNWKKSYLKK